MTFPILVEQKDGTFTASVVGAPAMAAAGATKDEAVAAVAARFRAGVAAGEVVLVDVPESPLPANRYTDQELEVMREQVAKIYRERDAQKAAEFPE